ncbi:hypothetical protein L1049_009323 [Liquidambar formosana]|uniref:Uncharacterized protein n=1 Tax=Liquidambar formosana TaxID=63359 RepID=A0AAP0S561_LIQFO
MTLNSLEYCTVETSDGINLNARIFKPIKDLNDGTGIVLVLPYSILGGSQSLLKGIALGLSTKGFRTIVFDMRGVLVYPQEGLFSRDLLKFVMLWLSANGPLIICLANRILLWVPLQVWFFFIFFFCSLFCRLIWIRFSVSANGSLKICLLVGFYWWVPLQVHQFLALHLIRWSKSLGS